MSLSVLLFLSFELLSFAALILNVPQTINYPTQAPFLFTLPCILLLLWLTPGTLAIASETAVTRLIAGQPACYLTWQFLLKMLFPYHTSPMLVNYTLTVISVIGGHKWWDISLCQFEPLKVRPHEFFVFESSFADALVKEFPLWEHFLLLGSWALTLNPPLYNRKTLITRLLNLVWFDSRKLRFNARHLTQLLKSVYAKANEIFAFYFAF